MADHSSGASGGCTAAITPQKPPCNVKLPPLIAPASWRETFRRVSELRDGQIRFFGLTSMLIGLILLMLFS